MRGGFISWMAYITGIVFSLAELKDEPITGRVYKGQLMVFHIDYKQTSN